MEPTTQFNLPFDLTAEQAVRLVNAFGSDYQETIQGVDGPIANTETKQVYAKRKIREYVKNYVLNYERSIKAVDDFDVA